MVDTSLIMIPLIWFEGCRFLSRRFVLFLSILINNGYIPYLNYGINSKILQNRSSDSIWLGKYQLSEILGLRKLPYIGQRITYWDLFFSSENKYNACICPNSINVNKEVLKVKLKVHIANPYNMIVTLLLPCLLWSLLNNCCRMFARFILRVRVFKFNIVLWFLFFNFLILTIISWLSKYSPVEAQFDLEQITTFFFVSCSVGLP